jgi:hypothetical protein
MGSREKRWSFQGQDCSKTTTEPEGSIEVRFCRAALTMSRAGSQALEK